jgi:uncharacterized membrane-anchored protein YjiN (DUF445 family)
MTGFERKTFLLLLIEKTNIYNFYHDSIHIFSFIMQKALNIPLEFNFVDRLGVFSFELQDELHEMLANDLIERKVKHHNCYYTTGIHANLLKKKYPNIELNYGSLLDKVIKKLAQYKVNELEKLSITLLVKLKEQIENNDECASRINKLKPFISKKEAYEIAVKIDELMKEFSEIK